VSATPRDTRSRPPFRAGAGVVVPGALVLVSALFSVEPLADAVTGEAFEHARLTRPVSYLLGAPLFGVWDTLSLLSASQHYAVIVSLLFVYAAFRLRKRGVGRSPAARFGLEARMAVGALVALLAFYAVGLLLPRPMVGLELLEPELLSVDFHSHTSHSHDGWGLFSARRNRAWHEAGGFDVGYVTDHYTWQGVDEALRDNPERVGERTALLAGAEIRIHRRPTNILGARSRYRFALGPDTIYMEPDSLRARPLPEGRRPTLLYTMPGALELVVPYSEHEPSGVIGIELNDGSPRGLEQVRRQRGEILGLADSLDLAVIAAANLHGWGRTVAAWSVMRVPGWRDLTPDQIAVVIEDLLHRERRGAGDVVERRMPYHDDRPVLVAVTLPWLTWEHFRMLSVGERLSWLAWLGIFTVSLSRLRARDAVPEEVG